MISKNKKYFSFLVFVMLVLGLIAPNLRADDDFDSKSQNVLEEHTSADGWSKATAEEKEMLGWVVKQELKIFFMKLDMTETFYPFIVKHGGDNGGKVVEIIGYTKSEVKGYIKNDDDNWKKSGDKLLSKDFEYFSSEIEMTPQKSFLLAFKHEEDCKKKKAGLKKQYGELFHGMTCEVSEKALDSDGDLKGDAGLSESAIENGLYKMGCVDQIDPDTNEKFEVCD